MKILSIKNTFYLGLMGLFFIDNCFAQPPKAQELTIHVTNSDKISQLTCSIFKSNGAGFEAPNCKPQNNQPLSISGGQTSIIIQPKGESIYSEITFEAIAKKTNLPLGNVDIMFSIDSDGAFSGVSCSPTEPEDPISCYWDKPMEPGVLTIQINPPGPP